MAALLAEQQVAFDYSLGWSHSVGEVFAEDYAYIHVHTRYGIIVAEPLRMPPSSRRCSPSSARRPRHSRMRPRSR